MKASDIMTKKVITISPGENIQRAIAVMEKHGIKELPVLENDCLVGMVRFSDIITIVRASPQMKVKKKMIQPPTIGAESDVDEVTELMLNTGIEGIPVVDNKMKVIGMISDYDILKHRRDEPAFKNPIETIMRGNVPTCKETDTVGDARKKMDFQNIDRIAVVNADNKIVGMVLQIDLLRQLYTQTSVGGRGGIRSDILPVMDFPVTGIARAIKRKVYLTDNISVVIDAMLSENLRGLPILNMNDEPIGIVARRDVLALLSKKAKQGVVINISGMALDDFANEEIISVVSLHLKKWYKFASRINEVRIHIKEVHGSEESKGKYEITLSIMGLRKPIISKEIGFEPAHIVDKIMDTIERILKE